MENNSPTFFIADRLRGIPLVSNGHRYSEQTTTNRKLEVEEKSSEMRSTATTTTSRPTIVQVGKRNADPKQATQRPSNHQEQPQQVTNQGGLLFRPSAITASTANMRRKSTTTQRPTTTTSTRRPKQRMAQNGDKLPKPAAGQPMLAKLLKPAAIDSQVVKAQRAISTSGNVMSTPQAGWLETSTSAATGQPMTNSATPISTIPLSTVIREQAPAMSIVTTTSSATISSSTSISTPSTQTLNPTTNSTRVAKLQQQTLTTQPDYQRRTPQTVLPPRYTNKLSSDGRISAGEHWTLFNRPDGNLSLFEVLVLMSNVMIVGTIITVIVFTWIKSMKKKRANQSKQPEKAGKSEQQQQQQAGDQRFSNSRSPSQQMDGTSDRTSKVSLISSSALSNPTTTLGATTISEQLSERATKMTSGQEAHVNTDNMMTGPRDATAAAAATATPTPTPTASAAQQPIVAPTNVSNSINTNQVSSPHNISSEFKSGLPSVANKAMAIVQPTENNIDNSSAHSGSDRKMSLSKSDEKLHENSRTINRSVSDLSGSANLQKAAALKTDSLPITSNSIAAPTTTERIAVLEQLFNESTTSNSNNSSSKNDSKITTELREKPKGNAINESAAATSSRLSTGSLESIELPATLVESISRIDPKNPTNVTAPSPNLLLTEQQSTSGAADVVKPIVNDVEGGNGNGNGNVNEDKAAGKGSADGIDSKVVAGEAAAALSKSDKGSVKSDRRQRVAEPVAAKGAKASQFKTDQRKPVNSEKKSTEPANKTTQQQARGEATRKQQQQVDANRDRPQNPMGRDETKPSGGEQANKKPMEQQEATKVANHQVVVNKLDKRKTNLQIVDLRDESVAGKMRGDERAEENASELLADESVGWISMDNVAVVQQQQQQQQQSGQATPVAQSPTLAQAAIAATAAMSPSEIIESRFHVDYTNKRRAGQLSKSSAGASNANNKDSMDSKMEEYILNNIENELEQDNKMRNRKYFVYIVHDGHFTAKKECIARIELPSKRRITLAEMRQLISNSQDISLSSLRRSKFKFVTETYRLLNENEDAAVLHQVYPTQGVFLKLNIPEQENQVYPFKSNRGVRLSSGSGGPGANSSSLAQTTIASRRRATVRQSRQSAELPAIEVEYARNSNSTGKYADYGASSGYGRTRASSVGRTRASAVGGSASAAGAGTGTGTGTKTGGQRFGRSKSSVQAGRGRNNQLMRNRQYQAGDLSGDKLPALDLDALHDNDFLDDELVDRRRTFTGTPLADMSDERMRIITPSKYCSRPSCGRLATIRCGVCNHAHYCSVQCRICDWPKHKQFCQKPRWKVWGQ